MFPTSPTNGDIYIKGSTPYIYASADNSWTQTTDEYLTASNIKDGVSILGVTGNYVASMGLRTYVALNASERLWYYKIGPYYIMSNFNAISGGQDTSFPPNSDATTRAKIAEKLDITIDSYGESNADSSILLKCAKNTSGDTWTLQDGGTILNYIKSA